MFFAVPKSLNRHLFGMNFDKIGKMYQHIFAISDYFQNLARHMKTKIILIHDVDLIIVTSYNIFHYLFCIRLWPMALVVKCWKLSKLQKIPYFLEFLNINCLI